MSRKNFIGSLMAAYMVLAVGASLQSNSEVRIFPTAQTVSAQVSSVGQNIMNSAIGIFTTTELSGMSREQLFTKVVSLQERVLQLERVLTINGLQSQIPGGPSSTQPPLAGETAQPKSLSICSDGIDNDSDGLIDYGTATNNDPGCVSATDTDEGYRLTVSVVGIGSVSANLYPAPNPPSITRCMQTSASNYCNEHYNSGTFVVLTAQIPIGQTVTWTNCTVGVTNTCNVSMDRTKVVTATFRSSAVACSDRIDNDGDGMIDYIGGSSAPADPGCTSTTDNDEGPLLSVQVIGNGNVSSNPSGIYCGNVGMDCTQHYNTGTVVNLTAIPAVGYVFQSWLGACSGSSMTCTVSMNAMKTVTATFTSNQTAGTLSVSTDPASPALHVVQAGSTNEIVGNYKFRASGENISLTSLGLKLTSGSPSSVVQVTIWDGATQVGSAVFTGTNTYAVSTLSIPVLISVGVDKSLTIKTDLSQVGSSQPGVEGDLIKIDYNYADQIATRGVGQSSGITIYATGATNVYGFRMYKTFPSFSLDTLPSSGVQDGRLIRFKETARLAGGVGVDKFTLTINANSASVSAVDIYAYLDSAYTLPVNGCGSAGRMRGSNQNLGPGVWEMYCQTDQGGHEILQIPAGQTIYFEARGTVVGSGTMYLVTTVLEGDSAFPIYPSTIMGSEPQIDADANDDHIWSPNTNGTSIINSTDWTNSYVLPGLPASGLVFTRSK